MKMQSIAWCILAAMLCSCASTTTVKQTWKAPDYQGGPLTKLAVLAIHDRNEIRRGFENRLSNELKDRGVSTVRSYELLSLSEINQDKQAAAERLRAAGADAIVIVRLVDLANFYRETRPGRERYAEVITGYEPGYWYDYYSVSYMSMNPTYGNLKQKLSLQTSVFDLKTAKRIWSGLTETSLTEKMDRVAEMDPIVAKAVAAMRNEGVVP